MLMSNGAFAEQSAGHDFFNKLLHSQGHSYMPAGVYLLALPFTFFPFALWALLAVPDSWQKRREPGVRFCIGWIVPSWIVFELVFSKLPHYVMPLYPAIALLAAKALLDGFPAIKALQAAVRWLPSFAAIVWLTTGIGLMVAAIALPYMLDHVLNKAMMATALLMLIAQIASLMFFFRRQESGVIIIDRRQPDFDDQSVRQYVAASATYVDLA